MDWDIIDPLSQRLVFGRFDEKTNSNCSSSYLSVCIQENCVPNCKLSTTQQKHNSLQDEQSKKKLKNIYGKRKRTFHEGL